MSHITENRRFIFLRHPCMIEARSWTTQAGNAAVIVQLKDPLRRGCLSLMGSCRSQEYSYKREIEANSVSGGWNGDWARCRIGKTLAAMGGTSQSPVIIYKLYQSRRTIFVRLSLWNPGSKENVEWRENGLDRDTQFAVLLAKSCIRWRHFPCLLSPMLNFKSRAKIDHPCTKLFHWYTFVVL